MFAAWIDMGNIQSDNSSYPIYCPNAETLDDLNEGAQPLTTNKGFKWQLLTLI